MLSAPSSSLLPDATSEACLQSVRRAAALGADLGGALLVDFRSGAAGDPGAGELRPISSIFRELPDIRRAATLFARGASYR